MNLALALLSWAALTMQRAEHVRASAVPPPENVSAYVAYVARRQGVPVDLAVCTAFLESRFDPGALGDWQGGAPRARGVWQWHAPSWEDAARYAGCEEWEYAAGAHDVAQSTHLAMSMVAAGYGEWWTGWRVCGETLRGEGR